MKRVTNTRRLAAAAILAILCSAPPAARSAQEKFGAITWTGTTHIADAGWARLLHLKGHDWLCVDNLYPKPNAIWQIESSSDDCKTWKVVTTIAARGRDLDNGDLVRLPNGDVLLTGRSVVLNPAKGERQSYHLPVYRSVDSGRTWTFVSQVDVSEPALSTTTQPSQGLWEPYLFVLDDGRVACAYANERYSIGHPSYSQTVAERISSDGGRTWGKETALAAQPGGGDLRPGMPVITRTRDGNYLAVYEIIGKGDGDIYIKVSGDGVHWPNGLGKSIPGQHHGPFATTLSDGRVLVTSCSNVISWSGYNGQSWQEEPAAVSFPAGSTSWPAIYQVSQTDVCVVTSFHDAQITWGAIEPRVSRPDFESDFTSGDAAWTRYGGVCGTYQGKYVLQNALTTGRSLTGDPHWSDGVLEGDVMLTSPGNAGLVFREINAGDAGPDDANGYYVGLDTSGSVVLGRQSGAYVELGHSNIPVAVNTWRHLKIDMQGPRITVYVDGNPNPAVTVSDEAFRHGLIGVRAHFCNAVFGDIRFTAARQ